MSSATSQFGTRLAERRTNQRGFVTWYKLEVFHQGLNEVKTVGDNDYDVAERKADALLAKMRDKWARLEAQEAVRQQKESGKDAAEGRTATATAEPELEPPLTSTIDIDEAGLAIILGGKIAVDEMVFELEYATRRSGGR